MTGPSSTQIGAIAVNHVANVLMISSGGPLSAFWPVADDDGIDLLIYAPCAFRAGGLCPAGARGASSRPRRAPWRGSEVRPRPGSRAARRPASVSDRRRPSCRWTSSARAVRALGRRQLLAGAHVGDNRRGQGPRFFRCRFQCGSLLHPTSQSGDLHCHLHRSARQGLANPCPSLTS
jgi:hypothetical protein